MTLDMVGEMLNAIGDGYTLHFKVPVGDTYDEVYVDASGWTIISEDCLTGVTTYATISKIESILVVLSSESLDWEVI